MKLLVHALTFVVKNKEVLTTLVVRLIVIMKLISWNRAMSVTLESVVCIIDKLGKMYIRTDLVARNGQFKASSKDGPHVTESRADTIKKTMGVVFRLVLEVLRGVFSNEG